MLNLLNNTLLSAVKVMNVVGIWNVLSSLRIANGIGNMRVAYSNLPFKRHGSFSLNRTLATTVPFVDFR